MSALSVIAVVAAAVIGIVVGYAAARALQREYEIENEQLRLERAQLRNALRNVRWGRAGVGVALLHYIDRVLGDEAA